MTGRLIRTDEPKRRLLHADKPKPRLNAAGLAEALGAAEESRAPAHGGSPVAWFALRQEVAARLRSSGGRPGLPDAEPRKVSMTQQEWDMAHALARAIAEPGFRPSAGQVAGVLLGKALRDAQVSMPLDAIAAAVKTAS